MDIVSSLNSAFTQVQRFENLDFRTGDSGSQVGYRERESTQNVLARLGLPNQAAGGPAATSSNHGVRSAVQNAVNYDRSESGSLMLTTQEGDTVRLKFLNSESYNAQNQQFESGGSVLSDFSLNGSSSSQFKVVVEGDLNGEELSAIREVLIQARSMANDFYDGDVEAAFGTATQFSMDSDQLANVSMQLNLRENYTYANTVAQTPAIAPPEENATQPIAPAITSIPPAEPLTEPTTPTAIAVPVSQPNVQAVASMPNPSTQALVSELAQEAPDGPEPIETPVHSSPNEIDPLANALSTISNFLNQIAESFDTHSSSFGAPTGNPAFSFSAGFQVQVMGTLIGQMNSQLPDGEASGHALAAATLDVVAMRMDARFATAV